MAPTKKTQRCSKESVAKQTKTMIPITPIKKRKERGEVILSFEETIALPQKDIAPGTRFVLVMSYPTKMCSGCQCRLSYAHVVCPRNCTRPTAEYSDLTYRLTHRSEEPPLVHDRERKLFVTEVLTRTTGCVFLRLDTPTCLSYGRGPTDAADMFTWAADGGFKVFGDELELSSPSRRNSLVVEGLMKLH